MDLVVLIDAPGFEVVGTSRLLKRAAGEAVVEANELLRRAQARDRALAERSAAAFEDARRRGFEQGMTEARDAMAVRLAAALAARQVALRDLAPTLVEIVADAVAVIAKNTPRRALLGAAFDTVGALLKQARWARLRVHPSQVDEARAALLVARGELAAADMVTVVADPGLANDGCIFETDAGIAEASLGVQLDAIRQAVGVAVAAAVAEAVAGAVAAAADAEADESPAPAAAATDEAIGSGIDATEGTGKDIDELGHDGDESGNAAPNMEADA